MEASLWNVVQVSNEKCSVGPTEWATVYKAKKSIARWSRRPGKAGLSGCFLSDALETSSFLWLSIRESGDIFCYNQSLRLHHLHLTSGVIDLSYRMLVCIWKNNEKNTIFPARLISLFTASSIRFLLRFSKATVFVACWTDFYCIQFVQHTQAN